METVDFPNSEYYNNRCTIISFLVAVETHLDRVWQIEAIQEGIREADLGHFANDEEVKEVLQYE